VRAMSKTKPEAPGIFWREFAEESGLAPEAVRDARKKGYIDAAEAKRLTRQVNQHAVGGGNMQGAKETGDGVSGKPVERFTYQVSAFALPIHHRRVYPRQGVQ
jgi:hypothetical protein